MPGPVVNDTEEEPLASLKEEQKQEDDAPVVEDVKEDDDDNDEDDGDNDDDNDEDDEDDDDDNDEDEEEDDDNDEDDEDEGEQVAGTNESSKQSRTEKKRLKAMLKLGWKRVTNFHFFFTIKRTEDFSVRISRPVYKSPNSETCITFNGAKIVEFRFPELSSVRVKPDVSAAAPADEDEEIDETGVDPQLIDLVMRHADVSKAKAVNALKAHDGDIVRALMELS